MSSVLANEEAEQAVNAARAAHDQAGGDPQANGGYAAVLDTMVQISIHNSKMIKRRFVFLIMILEREIFSQITQHELIILTQVTVCRINHNYAVNQKSFEKVKQ